MVWYIIFQFAGFLARHLPERWGRAIARRVGTFVYWVSPFAEAARENARHVLPPGARPDQVNAVVRRAFQNRVINVYEMLWLSHMPLEELARRSHLDGAEYVDELVQKQQGALLVSGHIGPIEFMMQSLTAFGYPIFGIVEHLESEKLHEYIFALRSSHGLKLLTTRDSLIDVYRRVKKGELLLSMMDRDSTNSGLVVNFFGKPACMPDGYARVAVRAGVPVLLGHCVRTTDGVVARIFPPIYPDPTLGREEAVMDVINRSVRILEGVIREDPAEWHLSTPIWRLAQERQGKEKCRENRTGVAL